jgi:VWFA-related protein
MPAPPLAIAALGLVTAGSPVATAGARTEPAQLNVEIVEPAAGVPVFGEITVRGAIAPAAEVARVVFEIDGRSIGERTVPPWTAITDVGEENRPHTVRVVAYDRTGRAVEAQRRLPAIRVDEHVDLELQQVYVTVTRGGKRVLGLERERFAIVDDGRRQEIVTFAGGEIPFSAVLVVDASNSMQGAPLAQALRGARAFVDGMRPLDQAQLLVVSDHLLEVTAAVERGELPAGALEGIEAVGGTAVFDALYLALEAVERRQGRRVVILLSDAFDGVSALSMQDLAEIARESRAMLYWIRPIPPEVSMPPAPSVSWTRKAPHLTVWRSPETAERNLEHLENAVERSAGRMIPITGMEEARSALEEVLQELREQYALGYYPEPRRDDGRWRKVRVRVRGAFLNARYQRGYFDW